MGRRILSITGLMLVAALMFSGCGSSLENSRDKADIKTNISSEKTYEDYDSANVQAGGTQDSQLRSEVAYDKTTGDKNDTTALTTSSSASQSLNNAILSQRKIIRNANISVEVEDFDKSYAKIKSMISAYGFIQESNIKKDKVYVDEKEELVTHGVIIIRVDKDKFENILSDIKGLGLLIDESIKSDDVTDKFFDTESRLRLLRFEESRLEDYLKKINDPETIFKTESRLTDIRHEIEGLTGTLKKWTDLVELSTITINLNEKSKEVSTLKDSSYWGELSDSFIESFKGVITFCGKLLIIFVTILPGLILMGIILVCVLFIYRKFIKRKFKLVSTSGPKERNDSLQG